MKFLINLLNHISAKKSRLIDNYAKISQKIRVQISRSIYSNLKLHVEKRLEIRLLLMLKRMVILLKIMVVSLIEL